jgi:hypothetical protein
MKTPLAACYTVFTISTKGHFPFALFRLHHFLVIAAGGNIHHYHLYALWLQVRVT